MRSWIIDQLREHIRDVVGVANAILWLLRKKDQYQLVEDIGHTVHHARRR
jgi:hypothetical protein